LSALARQGFRLAAGAIVDGDGMAGLLQVQRHWRTHVAEPDETHVHCLILLTILTIAPRLTAAFIVAILASSLSTRMTTHHGRPVAG
jgi:hypothetical protein